MMSTADGNIAPQHDWAARIVKRRVHITFAVGAILVVGSLMAGVQPHDLTNLGDAQSWIGVLLVVGGLAIRSWAAGTLRKYAELTTVGPYSIVRNPLYIGSMLMLIGFCILIGQGRLVWLIVGPFALLFLSTIKQEEGILSAQYGTVWQQYAAATPRFLPRTLAVRTGQWSAYQWRRNREYQAVAATVFGLVGLQLWQHV